MPDPTRHVLIENSIFDPVRLKAPINNAEPLQEIEGLPGNRPIVAYAGTFETYQGLELFIKGFRQVHNVRTDAFLLLIGGQPHQVEKYRQLAIDCGLDGHCLFTGMLDQAITKRCMTRASVIVSPRTEGTNTPLKIYEMLDSGIPIVATRVPTHEQVLNADICFLVDPEPKCLAAGVLAALNDDTKRCRIVNAARKLYRQRYARPCYEQKMRHLIQQVS